MIILECEQGSDEWFDSRLGIPTSSNFGKLLAKGQGKTRRSYLIQKAAEVLTGTMPESYTNEHMERGIIQEPEARLMYEFERDASVMQIGMALLDDESAGGSPDGLVGIDGIIEIKSVIPTVQIETILSGKMPPSHKPQIQGGLWILEREWCDFISYSPLIVDNPMVIIRQFRDDEYIDSLRSEVDLFNRDLREIVSRIKS